MRVALVVFGELADRSGGFRYDDHLRHVLNVRSHHVTVVSQSDGRSYQRQFSIARGDWPQRVAATAPDLVLIDELNHAATAAGLPDLRRRLPGVPVVAVVHHLRFDEQWGRFRAWWAERAFLRGCDAWLCNSSVTLHRVRAVSGVQRHSAVAFPAADGAGEHPPGTVGDAPSQPTGANRPAAADAAESEGDSVCRVICVGNLIPRKNVHRLIRALSALPGAHLDIYGNDTTDPRYTRRLRRMITVGDLTERVRIYGRVSDAVLAEAYSWADLLAVPSAYEGFGIVYLEALARGVPVIAGRRGGAVEIVTSDDAGRLVTPRVRQIVRAIRQVCGSGDTGGAHPTAPGGQHAAAGESAGRLSAVSRRNRRLAALRRAAAFPDWTQTMTGAVHFLETIARDRRDR